MRALADLFARLGRPGSGRATARRTVRSALTAFAVFVLAGACSERFTFKESKDGRVIYRIDAATGETWVSHAGSAWKKLLTPEEKARQDEIEAVRQQQRESEAAMLRAEKDAKRRRRAEWIHNVNSEHPERFRRFAVGDKVTILSGEDRVTLRGKQGVICSDCFPIGDPETQIPWKHQFRVLVDGREHTVDAEFLALRGSREESEDLSRNMPAVWGELSLSRQQENERVEKEQSILAEIKQHPERVRKFEFNDDVYIKQSAPVGNLRGRHALVGGERDSEYRIIDGKRTCIRRRYTVTIRLSYEEIKRAPFQVRDFLVDAEHLEYVGR